MELTLASHLRFALAAVLVVAAAALVDAQARTVEIVVGKTTKAEIIWPTELRNTYRRGPSATPW